MREMGEGAGRQGDKRRRGSGDPGTTITSYRQVRNASSSRRTDEQSHARSAAHARAGLVVGRCLAIVAGDLRLVNGDGWQTVRIERFDPPM